MVLIDWKDKFAYGGIVFDDKGNVLMRSPSGCWGGYVWTFAKGGADPDDTTPSETARREVKEETGYDCEILATVPGEYVSDTCTTKYFLMRPTGKVANFSLETEEVRWVCVGDAFEMIQLTRSPKGRLRDTAALMSALEVWMSLHNEQCSGKETNETLLSVITLRGVALQIEEEEN